MSRRAPVGTPMRMLFFPAERYPTDRVRINVLFGHELLSRGHAIDLVMQAGDARTPAGPKNWHGSTVFVGPAGRADTLSRRLRRLWRAFSMSDSGCGNVSQKMNVLLRTSIAAIAPVTNLSLIMIAS